MHQPDLEKLRRFSLMVALVILTYSLAGISIDSNASISIMGLSFKISRPDLLPIGLVIASVYTMISFYYYGFMLKKSPFRVRREIIDGLNVWEPDFIRGRKIFVYFGPTTFETTPRYSEKEIVESYILNFPEAFPKFARAKATAKLINEESFDEDGNPYMSYAAKITIPKRCRLAAIFQDFDYASPVWLNIVALVVLLSRILT